jgi:hypothetical protein
MTLDQINKRIAAAEKYRQRMQNQGRTAQAAGAGVKLDDFYRQRAALTKPPSISDNYNLQETLAEQSAQETYDAGNALRNFQREQAQRQLKDALGEIDRSAIANYKGIANDYAARGMARSGGFMGAESEAMASRTRADEQARQAVTDFLEQLRLQGNADLAALNTTKQQIMADYLARRFAPAQGG